MADRIILCALSTLNLVNGNLPDELVYTVKLVSGSTMVAGRQTNEAPVKCLLDIANDAGDHVSRVVYLCSEECREPISGSGVSEVPVDLTTEDYFKHAICAHCEAMGVDKPAFKSMPYATEDPARFLGDVIEAIEGSDFVDVDTTGGLRDVMPLFTLAILTLQTASLTEGAHGMPRLGTVVYSNFVKQKISPLNDTYGITSLTAAVEAFLRYGKADGLKEYFCERDGEVQPSVEVRKLCEAAGAFADDLSLCRVDRLPDDVDKVRRMLEEVRSQGDSKGRRYTYASTCLDRLEGKGLAEDDRVPADAWGEVFGFRKRQVSRARHFTNALFEVYGIDYQTGLRIWGTRGKKVPSVRDALEELRNANELWRGELLFLKLVPAVEGAFLRTAKGPGGLVEMLRWCVRHGMLQQALALFRERVPDFLVQRGLIEKGGVATGRRQQAWVQAIRLLCLGRKDEDGRNGAIDIVSSKRIDATVHRIAGGESLGGAARRRIAGTCLAGEVVDERWARVTKAGERRLPAILTWYANLTDIRNEVMHASADEDNRATRERTMRVVLPAFGGDERMRCAYDEDDSFESLRRDLTHAIDVLESGGVTLDRGLLVSGR